MSYRSGHHAEHHHHDHGRQPARQPVGHAPAGAQRAQNGYTLVHAGKQVRFGPVAFWIVIGTVTALGMWSALTATYFAFRDDVLTRLIARQAEMQYAYEDRIAELRAKVDRTTSRQLLDQEQFDQKLEQVMRRQTALESRQPRWAPFPICSRPDRSGRHRAARRPIRLRQVRRHPRRSAIPPSSWRLRIAKHVWNRGLPIIVNPPANKFAKIQGVDNVIVRLQTARSTAREASDRSIKLG